MTYPEVSPPPHPGRRPVGRPGTVMREDLAQRRRSKRLNFFWGVLGGSWYLFTSSNGTYNPLISPLSALIWL